MNIVGIRLKKGYLRRSDSYGFEYKMCKALIINIRLDYGGSADNG